MYLAFDELPANARVWVYQSTDFLTFEKVERASARLMNFLEDWQAHGKDLKASFTIRHDRFIIVALDEASYQATGCSIDKLTHLIQKLEHELEISLLDRTQIAYRDDNKMVATMHMVNFRAAISSGEMDEDTTVFNNLIETKGQLAKEWQVPLLKSWHKQWLPIA
jgi:regulator of PEP synthase PpsR (kinase-PPPase family)